MLIVTLCRTLQWQCYVSIENICGLSITVYGQLVHNKNTMNPTEAFMELREANLAECNKTYRGRGLTNLY